LTRESSATGTGYHGPTVHDWAHPCVLQFTRYTNVADKPWCDAQGCGRPIEKQGYHCASCDFDLHEHCIEKGKEEEEKEAAVVMMTDKDDDDDDDIATILLNIKWTASSSCCSTPCLNCRSKDE
jgi:hypothetical protein